MNIDFHVHGAISKSIPFGLDLFRQTLDAARAAGLDALALTDHADAKNTDRVHRALEREFDYVGPHYLASGLRLLPGLEVGVSKGPHLIVIGDRETLSTYRQRLRLSINGQGACPARVFFDIQEDLETLTIFAHPFRNKCEVCRVDRAIFTRVDAIGLNARDLYFHGALVRGRTEIFARTYGLPIVAGSDTHHFHQVGSVYNQFQRPFNSIADLRSLIAEGAYRIRIHRELGDKVAAARKAKRALKKAARRTG